MAAADIFPQRLDFPKGSSTFPNEISGFTRQEYRSMSSTSFPPRSLSSSTSEEFVSLSSTSSVDSVTMTTSRQAILDRLSENKRKALGVAIESVMEVLDLSPDEVEEQALQLVMRSEEIITAERLLQRCDPSFDSTSDSSDSQHEYNDSTLTIISCDTAQRSSSPQGANMVSPSCVNSSSTSRYSSLTEFSHIDVDHGSLAPEPSHQPAAIGTADSRTDSSFLNSSIWNSSYLNSSFAREEMSSVTLEHISNLTALHDRRDNPISESFDCVDGFLPSPSDSVGAWTNNLPALDLTVFDSSDSFLDFANITPDSEVCRQNSHPANVTLLNDSEPKERTAEQSRLNHVLVEKEHFLLEKLRLCTVCSSKPRNITFLPCGHFTTCQDCSEPLYVCPLCHRNILATINTFLS